MRFHMTTPCSTARKAYEEAANAANEEFDKNLGQTPEYKPLHEAETAALRAFMVEIPATTPTELAEKIKLYHEREMTAWDISGEFHDAILLDCARMQGWPLSATFLEKWMAWRKLDQMMQSDMTAEDEKQNVSLRGQAYSDITMSDCTTTGDFILKRYLRLHTTNGPAHHSGSKEDLAGNPWDIDIDDHTHEARFETADKLGCYHDINHTDLGMHLLAYGLPYFDAKAWMEAANRTGLQVDLCLQEDGRESISVGMLDRDRRMLGVQEDNDDTSETPLSPRIRRERDRLRRILANVCVRSGTADGRDRCRAVADEIRDNWPQLVWRAPPIVPAEHLVDQEEAA